MLPLPTELLLTCSCQSLIMVLAFPKLIPQASRLKPRDNYARKRLCGSRVSSGVSPRRHACAWRPEFTTVTGGARGLRTKRARDLGHLILDVGWTKSARDLRSQ